MEVDESAFVKYSKDVIPDWSVITCANPSAWVIRDPPAWTIRDQPAMCLGTGALEALAREAAKAAERVTKTDMLIKGMTGMTIDDLIGHVSKALGVRVKDMEFNLTTGIGRLEAAEVTVSVEAGALVESAARSARLEPTKVLKPGKPSGGTVVYWKDGPVSHAEPHDGDGYRPLMGELVVAAKRVMSDPLKGWEPMLHAIVDWLGDGDLRARAGAMRTLSRFASVAADVIDMEAAQCEKDEAERKAAEEELAAKREADERRRREERRAARDARVAKAVAKALED